MLSVFCVLALSFMQSVDADTAVAISLAISNDQTNQRVIDSIKAQLAIEKVISETSKPAVRKKKISVLKIPGIPGKYERRCVNGICQEVWIDGVAATFEDIEVDETADKTDENFLKKWHYRLGPGSCGMFGCVSHPGRQVLVDENDTPVSEEDRKAEEDAIDARNCCNNKTKLFPNLFRRWR